jgi:hypothetical protein
MRIRGEVVTKSHTYEDDEEAGLETAALGIDVPPGADAPPGMDSTVRVFGLMFFVPFVKYVRDKYVIFFP